MANKALKSSSGFFLSQNFWRILRNILSKSLWNKLYILFQKIKISKLIKILDETNLDLKKNLSYYDTNIDQLNDNKNYLDFSKLIKKYNTSKPEGEYRDFLDKLFWKIKPNTKTVLEIGISYGGGLMAMRDFFENSYLWGVDIDKDTFIYGDRIKQCAWIDQLKLKTMKSNAEIFNVKFDLIVDDGWHHPESQINTLIAYLPYLNISGVYILEDIVHKQYFKYFLKIIKIIEKKGFSCEYKNFNLSQSGIADNLGYLIIYRNY